MTKPKSKNLDFWHSRQGYASTALIALLLAYAFVSLAINSGSLIQYFLGIVSLGVAINRIAKIVKGK